MDISKTISLVEQLDDDIDDLVESLAPLLEKSLTATASKLPLLDKAKLYILITYAIESILFSYLRINGVRAREHPVFTELTRVKQYFEKIRVAETPAASRNAVLDKAVAGRFIKAGLSGNDKWDLLRAEEKAKERARAHIKFEELSQRIEKRRLETIEKSNDESDSESSSSSSSKSIANSPELRTSDGPRLNKRQDSSQSNHQSSEHSSFASNSSVSSPIQKEQGTSVGPQQSPKRKRPSRQVRKRAQKAKAIEKAAMATNAPGQQ